MNIGAAPRRFAGGIDPDMAVGLAHNAHQLTFALHFAAAHTGALRNVLCHLNYKSSSPKSIRSLPRPALRCFLAITTPCSSSKTSVRSLRLLFFLPPLRS